MRLISWKIHMIHRTKGNPGEDKAYQAAKWDRSARTKSRLLQTASPLHFSPFCSLSGEEVLWLLRICLDPGAVKRVGSGVWSSRQGIQMLTQLLTTQFFIWSLSAQSVYWQHFIQPSLPFVCSHYYWFPPRNLKEENYGGTKMFFLYSSQHVSLA